MKASAVRLIKIFSIRMKANAMARLAYPANFFILLISSFAQTFITVTFVKVIYGFTDQISGWTSDQAILVVATFLLVEAMIWFTAGYLYGIRRNIKEGNFDIFLVQPISPLFSIATWRIDIEDILRIALALSLLTIGMKNYHLGLLNWIVYGAAYIYLLVIAYVIYFCILLLINCAYFWYTEVNNITQVVDSIIRTGQYPTDILAGKAVRLFFSSLIPIAFLATAPAKIFVFGVNYTTLIYGTLIAAALMYATNKIWQAGLKVYSSASS